MSADEVSICNRALGLIAARATISDLTENSPAANACAMWYPDARDWLLRTYRWNFARAQISLTQLATAPGVDSTPASDVIWPFAPWAYEYAYPPDCLVFRYVLPTWNAQPWTSLPIWFAQPPVPFTISTDLNGTGQRIKVVLTNQPQAVGIYTVALGSTNVGLFDPGFVECLIYALAARLAMPLTGDKTIAMKMAEQAQAMALQAQASDGREGLSSQDVMPDWLRVRGAPADYPGTMWWPSGPYGPWGGGWPSW